LSEAASALYVRADRRYDAVDAGSRISAWRKEECGVSTPVASPVPAGAMTHVPKMRRVARGILGREDLAADAVQEALISFFELTRPPGNPEAWLVRTVVHRSLSARRAHLRRLRNEQRAVETLEVAAAFSDPERELRRRELSDQIAAALDLLSGEQRQAFLLKEFCGHDYRRISGIQRVPIGTVRSRLNRAREALRKHLRSSERPTTTPDLCRLEPLRGPSSMATDTDENRGETRC
jgi:RNA polymerase sigma-70 factor (ECF subfamily)